MEEQQNIRRVAFAPGTADGVAEYDAAKEEETPLRIPAPPTMPRPSRTVSHVHEPPYMKLANPGPLGLLGFAITTFVLGLYECGAGYDFFRNWKSDADIFAVIRLPHSDPTGDVGPNQAVFGLAIFMGGAAQFVAGIMQFRVGNTFGSTVHCSYGAFWLSYAMFLIPSLDIRGEYKGDERAYTFAIAIYLTLWCFLTFLFLIAALRTNIAILLLFFFLTMAFLFLALANYLMTEHPTAAVRLNKTGGAFAVICAAVAFYGGASGLMLPETTFVRFPLGEFPHPAV
jgi:succinate-acetate transporter protein